jgi:molecular chaperone DnaK (HSP70)
MTFIQEQLLSLFNNRIDELCKTINPDESVACGTAVQGAILKAGGSSGDTSVRTEDTSAHRV